MKLGQYDVDSLIKEGLGFYFGQATLNYDLLRQDLLGIKPMQSVLDVTSSTLNSEEQGEKDKALIRLVKEAYYAQIKEDTTEKSQDEQAAKRDESRALQIPAEIAQCESQIQSNRLSIQQEQDEISVLNGLNLALLPRISVYDATIASIERELSRLRRVLASTPKQIVVSNTPAGPMPPPPHTAQRVTTGSQQVAVSTSTPMPPPPVRQGNPEYGRLETQISAEASRLSTERTARGLLTAQQLQYASSIGAHEGRIRTLEDGNSRNTTRISELNHELNTILPQKERGRKERLAARQARQAQRDAIATEINQSDYQLLSVNNTLTSANQRTLDHKIEDAYRALRTKKTLIFNLIKSVLYDQFVTELDTQLPNLSLLSKQEQEALRLIKRNLSDHFRTVEAAKEAHTTLQESKAALREARAFVRQKESRLSTLQASNPALNNEIKRLESSNGTHTTLLEANQASRKQWGRGTTVCVVLTLAVASPLIIYAAGALSLSALALGLISAGASVLGLGSLVTGIKTLLFNRAANRESQIIEQNTDEIRQKKGQISREAAEIQSLQTTVIPNAKGEVAQLEKVVEGNQNTLDSLNRQADQYIANAKAITPTTLSTFVESPLASAPPKEQVVQNQEDYPPDSELPPYSATA